MGVLEQKKTFGRAPSAPAVSSQTSESIGPKKLETPWKSRARKRESRGPWCHLKGELVSEKEISHCSEDFTTVQEIPEPILRRWEGPHHDWIAYLGIAFVSCLTLSLTSQS